jgi:hypothetical protein
MPAYREAIFTMPANDGTNAVVWNGEPVSAAGRLEVSAPTSRPGPSSGQPPLPRVFQRDGGQMITNARPITLSTGTVPRLPSSR